MYDIHACPKAMCTLQILYFILFNSYLCDMCLCVLRVVLWAYAKVTVAIIVPGTGSRKYWRCTQHMSHLSHSGAEWCVHAMPPQHHRTQRAGMQLRWQKRRAMGVEENPVHPNHPSPLHNCSCSEKGKGAHSSWSSVYVHCVTRANRFCNIYSNLRINIIKNITL